MVGGRPGRNLVLQANKGAEQETLQEISGRNSHNKLLVLRIDLSKPESEQEFIDRWMEGLKKYFKGCE